MTHSNTILTLRFQDALILANRWHAGQRRKGSGIPYISHLLGVTALVLEEGGDEDEAIAALLHDAAEDQGGRETLADIERRFGPRVASIVEGCSDTFETPKPPWRARKEAYIAHIREASPEVRRVSLADKVHNVRTLLADYTTEGEALWERFRAGRTGTLWYYQTLAGIFCETNPGWLADELERAVRELECIVKHPGA